MRIGAQLYTIRRAFAEDCSGALARLREAGYEYAELAGLGGHPIAEVRRAFEAAGVSAIAMHVPLDRLAREYDLVVDEARALGIPDVVVPWLGGRYRRDGLDGYRRAARELVDLAGRLKADGLGLHYHNHDVELAELDGRSPLDVLLEETTPALGLELDLGWIRFAGHDPGAWLRRAAGRVRFSHWKDVAIRAGRSSRFGALGEGVIDWSDVVAAASAVGLAWAIVEDDDALDPFGSLARSRSLLRGLSVAA
ncbi:MAG TPA: sugar phosphate isomerase/epimerase [Candidatus Limnocylindrales bacterium]|nr:sugar phosphate isomerase/epimerase [Candidatus Limnocylindrales bacterium]